MAKNKFKEHGCEFKNETECEEELGDDDLDFNEAERDFYEDEY